MKVGKMKNYNREELLLRIGNFRQDVSSVMSEDLLDELNALENQIKQDCFQVVVLGEFKRGKSTFVNALCGSMVLPMDVLPETATINIVLYSDEPKLEIVYKDGLREQCKVSDDVLKRFSASSTDEDLAQIKYLKVGLPIETLKNRICIVDTPGVADLDETRSEITYSYIPNANAILFLLDANAPLTKTEKDFIENKIIPLGIRDIIFILNKFDEVDEDDEEDLLSDVTLRLKKTFNYGKANASFDSLKVFPLSARDALLGQVNMDDDLLAYSGIENIRHEMMLMLDSGNVGKSKIEHYNKLLQIILNKTENYIEEQKEIIKLDKNDLRKYADELNKVIKNYHDNEEKIDEYTKHMKSIAYGMVDKSTHYFIKNLTQSVLDDVDLYQGVEFKDFIEKNMKRKIEKNIDLWLTTYVPNINLMLRNIENELTLALCNLFNSQVRLRANLKNTGKTFSTSLRIQADDISSVTVQAGAIAAIGSMGLFAIAGSSLMPFISFAAIPMIRSRMMKNKLNEAKKIVIPEIRNQLIGINSKLNEDVHKYIDTQLEIILSNTKGAYEMMLNRVKKDIDDKIAANEDRKAELVHRLGDLEQAGNRVSMLLG